MINNNKVFIEERRQRAINFKNDEKFQEEYEEYENMKHTLSNTLYSKSSHFIYELIQNAEDNTYLKNFEPFLKFIVSHEGILTQNNEIGFNEENVKSICKFSSSSKKGKKELGFIGEKGLGFKAVFAITDKPMIVSNGYQFHFKMGEYTIPYWIEDNKFSNYPKELFNQNTTNIYLPFKKDFSYKEDIQEKIKDIEPIVLLFLKKLHSIQIIQNNKIILDVKKQNVEYVNGFLKIVLKYNDIEDSFYVVSKIVDKPFEINEETRENIKKREITLAFPAFNNKIQDDRVFSFLPTEMKTNLKFMVQTDFLLMGNRENLIEDSEWNQWLLDEIVIFFIEIFKNLQEVNRFKYLKYLQEESSRYDFFDRYYQQILEKLKDEKLFLTIDNQWVGASEVCVLDDYDFMIDYLEDINYKNKAYTHRDFHIPQNLYDLWDIEIIDKNNFLDILGTNHEIISLKFQKNNLLFDNFLNYIKDDFSIRYSDSLITLPIIPFDMDDGIKFKNKEELGSTLLFYKLDEEGVLRDIFNDIKSISQKYSKDLEEISFYSDKFSIKQPNLLEILKNLNRDILYSIDNNVKLLVYIKNNLTNNKDEIIELLIKNYGFLSKENYVIKHLHQRNNHYRYEYKSPLYIAQEYLDSDNCMENIVNKYCEIKRNQYFDFVSTKYLDYDKKSSDRDIAELKKEWREFFNLLKINDDLKIIDETIEMVAYDSQDYPRKDNINYQNIPFIIIKEKVYEWSKEKFTNNFDFKELTLIDSIFFFKKIIGLSNIDSTYHKLTGFYRERIYTTTTVPWIKEIQNNYPIYINMKLYKINDLYLDIDKEISKFFHTLPKEYLVNSNSYNINKIFNLKDKPSKEDIVSLIEDKKLTTINEAKNILSYLKQHFDEIQLTKIPIDGKNGIEYLKMKYLIWENGKELNLIDVKPSYRKSFKSFFIDVLGVQEKPSVEQYVEFLQKRPKQYQMTFYKFIQQLGKSLNDGSLPDVSSLKLCKINSNYFSFDEIIYNDEHLNTDKIDTLLTVNKKYHSTFLSIVDKYNIEKMSDFNREIVVNNVEEDEEIYNIYILLLNFTWDYIFSKDANEFDKLKENRNFILETKKVQEGAWAKIDLKIYIDTLEVDISQDIVMKDNILYLSENIDARTKIKVISQFISNKINIDFEALELFYLKVYEMNHYTVEEYYAENDIKKVDGSNSFDSVFKKVLNDVKEESQEDDEEELDTEEENSESVQTLEESLLKNQGDGESLEVTETKNRQIEIIDDGKYQSDIAVVNDTIVVGHIRKTRTIRQEKNEKKQIEIIRKFLYREYAGHCQICGDTFAYKSKNELDELNNFKRFSLNRGKNRDVLRKGNSMSLCLKHHKIFELNLQKNEYLDFLKKPLSLDFIDKNENFLKEDWVSDDDIEYEEKIYKAFYRLKKGESFMRDYIYFLPIRLFGKDEYIKFTKAHLIEFIEVWNEN